MTVNGKLLIKFLSKNVFNVIKKLNKLIKV